MAKRKETVRKESCDCNCSSWHRHGDGAGMVYCLGVIGAAVYYIQQAGSFWMGVLGVLKALVWPAILVYKLLGM